jgi:uncharacterized protein YqjF (DUF2071 family)
VTTPDGRSGVWFFSLDAARLLAVAGARLSYGLPYCWSKMRARKRGERIRYESHRRWPDTYGTTDIEVEHGEPTESRELEIFLTARFRLFSIIAGRLVCANVEHPPWPLHAARIVRLEQTLTSAARLSTPHDPPLVHFSPGVSVRVGAPWPVIQP